MPDTTKDTCLKDLQRRILALDLAPGAALDEAALARHYGMSRTPMREVLQRLAGSGYARQEENRGAKVASMDLPSLRVFFQTAPMVYANIARLAAQYRTTAQLAALKDAQMAFSRATSQRDAGATALANHRFHAVIGAMAHNPYLVAALERLLIDHTRLSQTFFDPRSPGELDLVDTARDQHDRMIDAIDAQSPDAAVDLTMQHWDLSRDRLERFVRPDPLPVDLTEVDHAV